MTATYDPALCERLIASARDPKALCGACDGHGYTSHTGPISGEWTEPCESCNLTGFQVMADCADLADQLAAAKVRIEDLEGEAKDRGCPVHVGSTHGGEAEELRAGIERLIESDCDDLEGMRERMQRLLDRVDARLAHPERSDLRAEIEEARHILRAEIEEARHILGAGFSNETLKQAAERVEVNCAERARERDALLAEVARLRALAVEALLMAKPITRTDVYERMRAEAYRAASKE